MTWDSLAEFLSMGGYGPYVWGAFGMVAALIGLELLLLGQRWRRAGKAPRQPVRAGSA